MTMSMAPAWGAAAEPVPIQSPTRPAPPTTGAEAGPPVQSPDPTVPPAEAPAEAAPSAPSAEPGVSAEAPVPAPVGYGVMIEQGQALIGQGLPGQGALRLSDAYVSMPAELRVGDWGRDVVAEASAAFVVAGGAAPDPVLLDAEQALLIAYFADLGEARASGRPTVAADEVERALSERLAHVEQALASGQSAPGIDEIGPIDGQGPAAPPDPRARRVARLLIGGGAVGSIGGGAMVIIGAVAASRAEEQRPLAGPDEVGAVRQTKRAGTLMATFGALIFSASVMVLGVGTNRLGELREGSRLSVYPTRRGLALSGRF